MEATTPDPLKDPKKGIHQNGSSTTLWSLGGGGGGGGGGIKGFHSLDPLGDLGMRLVTWVT